MTYYKAGWWFTRILLPDGRKRVVSCGTTDKIVARAVENMVHRLAGKREWTGLTAVIEKRTTLPQMFDAYERGELSAFLARLNDADLDALVTTWKEAGANATYVRQVRAMIVPGARYPASSFTRKAVSTFLAGLGLSGSTRNRYKAALSVFAGWLVEREVISTNPVRDVRGSKENAPRDRWLSTAQAQAVCDASGPTYRSLFALLYGAGAEISAALAVRKADIDPVSHTVHLRGSKTQWRNRTVVVSPWAWERFWEAWAPTLGNHALYSECLSYMDAYRAHKTALGAVKLTGYTMHDARHSYAVNALRSGMRPEVVAHQLGHRDTTLLMKVYGRYVPEASDYAKANAT